MKPEQQRIAIAKACGWKPQINELASTEKYKTYTEPPDYLYDLNAMHVAEEILIELGVSGFYMDNLANIASCAGQYVIMATSAQRAEAFLRTLHLWEDEN